MISNCRRYFSRNFRVLGVQQIAIGNVDKSVISHFYGDLLGFEKVKTFKAESENVDEDVYKIGKGLLGTIEVDLMAPIDPEKKPAVHIPPLNHIGFWVDDLAKCTEYLTANNVKCLGRRMGASGYDVDFLHPKTTGGVLVELVQAPPEVIEEYDRTK